MTRVKDIPILEKKILDMLPITQAEIWNTLGIDSRDCSSIISGMINKGLVKKTKADKTFLVESTNGIEHGEKEKTPIVEKEKTPIVEKEKVEDVPVPEVATPKITTPKIATPKITSEDDRNKKIKIKTTDIKRRALDMLPIAQPELWKRLGINRRAGSRLVVAMLKEGLIERIKVDNVFLIERADRISSHKKDFSALLSNGKFCPCCGCMVECDPKTCLMLTEWLA